MLPRWRFWLGLALLLAAALVVVVQLYWLSLPYPLRVYHRLHVGMTLAEVEQTIGSPPGNQPGVLEGPPITMDIAQKASPAPPSSFHSGPRWIWKDYIIWLYVTDDDKVVIIMLMKRSSIRSTMGGVADRP
jgi:hypothetical protein